MDTQGEYVLSSSWPSAKLLSSCPEVAPISWTGLGHQRGFFLGGEKYPLTESDGESKRYGLVF